MTSFEIAFYSLLMFGILIGIGIGLYVAFHLSKYKLDRKEYKDFNAEERAKAKAKKAQEKQKAKQAKQEAKEKERIEQQKQKEEQGSEPPVTEAMQDIDESVEPTGRMAEVISKRQALESLTDFNCDIDGVNEQEAIEKARQQSNQAYQYLSTKINE